MQGWSLWFGLVLCALAGGVVSQEARLRLVNDQEEPRAFGTFSASSSLEHPLEAILGSLDVLDPALDPALDPVPTVTTQTTPLIRREDGVYSGLTVGLADNWQSGLAYMFLTSPSRTFPNRENPGVRVSYDDSRMWSSSFPSFKGLQPSATVGFETSEYLRRAADTGVYLQVGIKPGYELKLPGDHPLVASLPVTLGLGSDYNEFARTSNRGFGYLDVGLAVSTPLSLLPERFGSWGVTAAVNFLFLSAGQEALNGGDDFEVIGSITFGFDF